MHHSHSIISFSWISLCFPTRFLKLGPRKPLQLHEPRFFKFDQTSKVDDDVLRQPNNAPAPKRNPSWHQETFSQPPHTLSVWNPKNLRICRKYYFTHESVLRVSCYLASGQLDTYHFKIWRNTIYFLLVALEKLRYNQFIIFWRKL
jgi:hypothetical protein